MARKPPKALAMAVARKPKTLPRQALVSGLMRIVKMPIEVLESLGLDPSTRILESDKDFIDEHIDEFVDAYLEKLMQRERTAVPNRARRQSAAQARDLYRRTAVELCKKLPGLSNNVSAQARAVMRKLGLPQSRFERVRKALSKS
jgi:hypothetical protein